MLALLKIALGWYEFLNCNVRSQCPTILWPSPSALDVGACVLFAEGTSKICVLQQRHCLLRRMSPSCEFAHGGGCLLSSGTRLPPPPIHQGLVPNPPLPPCPPGPLSCQGSTATGHTYGGAQGARKISFHSPCLRGTPPCPGAGTWVGGTLGTLGHRVSATLD